MIISSITEVVGPKNWVNNCYVGIWFCKVLFKTYIVVGSYWMVWTWVGIGIFASANCMAIGVNGLTIYAY
jgi:hypothetical protein